MQGLGSRQFLYDAPAMPVTPAVPTMPATPDRPAAAALLQMQGLRFGYGPRALFDGLQAQIDRPGVYGLFGHNGSGKSTLLKLLAGLLGPQAGQIRVLGQAPRQRRPQFLQQVYILPEEFHLPNLTPQQLQRTHGGFYPQFDAALFAHCLQALQVPGAQRFGGMSLGQKKKAALAFALAVRTPLLLLDEPTNGLDILGRSRFKELLMQPEQAGRTVLVSTHQAHDLEQVLQHIWFLGQGRLLLDASMAELGQRLRLGLAPAGQALPPGPPPIHQEAMGGHTVWLAARRPGEPAAPVPLELLYKAISLNEAGVLAALQAPPAQEDAP